jgi:hypothetical protein
MPCPKRNICPFCSKKILAAAAWCGSCGRDLPFENRPDKSSRQYDLYEIVPDGETFGIALSGKIKIHGLELENAQTILTALNRMSES